MLTGLQLTFLDTLSSAITFTFTVMLLLTGSVTLVRSSRPQSLFSVKQLGIELSKIKNYQ